MTEHAAASPETITIENIFGSFSFTPEKLIQFNSGLVGLPDFTRFALANIPDNEESDLKLLQSIDEPDLSFLIMPMSHAHNPLEEADLADVLQTYNIAESALGLFFIVTMKQTDDGDLDMTLNIRAPILINLDKRTGRQHVFSNNKYPLKMPVGELG